MLTVGTRVIFNSKFFKPPYTPWYDAYADHVFVITHRYIEEPYGSPESPHYTLWCVDKPTLKVNGNVHADQLVVVPD